MLERFGTLNRFWTRFTAGVKSIDSRWEEQDPAILALRKKALDLHIDP